MGFIQKHLPWLLAGVAFVVYCCTLNHWLSLGSLPIFAKATGLDWLPPLNSPLTYLVSCSIRLFPAAQQGFVLNLIFALFAALNLLNLARCVALLPQDRTKDQRMRERSEFSLITAPLAWLAPTIAVVGLMLQSGFWANATVATGEMLDLLFFSFAVRAILEYRISGKDTWLFAMALTYGIGITNNSALIAFFPLFLVALIWIRGLGFFQPRFMMIMTIAGLAGLLFYLIPPLLNVMQKSSSGGFLQTLKFELKLQKDILTGFPRSRVIIMGLTSVLPALLIGIRWPSTMGDTSAAGAALTTFFFRFVHLALAGLSAWLMFDPKFSPLALGYGYQFLPFYWLAALALGYYTGYLLVVFGMEPRRQHNVRNNLELIFAKVVPALLLLAVPALGIGLVFKNLQTIRANNSPVLREYASQMASSLPAKACVVISDEERHALLVRAYLAEQADAPKHIFLVSQSLSYVILQRHLFEQYKAAFPPQWGEFLAQQGAGDVLNTDLVQDLMMHFVRNNETYYLHPSFGYFFENIYLKPQGLVYKVATYQGIQIAPPKPAKEEIQANQEFWKGFSLSFNRLAPAWLRTTGDAKELAQWYSRAANHWGVTLQRANELPLAAEAFKLAISLNPKNISAIYNGRFNDSQARRKPWSVDDIKQAEEAYGPEYRDWTKRATYFGPVDEPYLAFDLARTYAVNRLHRQAAINFQRLADWDPQNLEVRLWLANMFYLGGLPDRVLEIIAEIRAKTAKTGLQTATKVDLIRLEANAFSAKGNLPAAEQTLLNAGKQLPEEDSLRVALSGLYLRHAKFTEAMGIFEEELRRNPNNLHALFNQGAVYIQLKQFTNAIAPLNKVLAIQSSNTAARLNLAIAQLQSGRLEEAKANYEVLRKTMPESQMIYYGLAEIAVRQKEKSAAIANFTKYLELAPGDSTLLDPATGKLMIQRSEERHLVEDRLKKIRTSGL